MRYTILTQYYPPEVGAVQVRLSAFAHELKRSGHLVQVVTALPNYPSGIVQAAYRRKFLVQEEIDEIPVIRTWIYPATGKNIVKRLANYFSFTLSCLFALLWVPRADILFVESPPLFLGISAWLMAALRRQKLCINISDLWPDSVVELGIMPENNFIRLARILERWLYKRAWRVCGVTEGILTTLAKTKGVPQEKLLFLPNGVDLTMFRPTSPDDDYVRQLGLEGKKIFAYTGLHGYAQGLDVILLAAEQLRHRPNIVFLFVGDGPEKPRLQTLAEQLALANVIFHDPQPVTQMPRIFALTTACIVPLRNIELFQGARPSKMFPPLGCAKPLIYSGAGEAATLIKKAECGIVTPPEDANALAQAVLRFAEQPELAATMGANGRAFVEREYSWTQIVKRWSEEISIGIEHENRHDYRRPASVH